MLALSTAVAKLRRKTPKSKPLYQYLFDMLDYADELAKRIVPEDPDRDNRNYFITLVYIEDILDKYGRGLVSRSAYETYGDAEKASEMMHLSTKRMEALRYQIRILAQKYDFDEELKSRSEEIYANWHKPPKDHPNIRANPDFQA